MLIRLGLLSFFLVQFVGSAIAQDEPFAFRGFTLGMTADEFRRTPHPDRAQSWLAKKSLKVMCTGDPVPKGRSEPLGIGPPAESRKAGVIWCGYIDPAEYLLTHSVTINGYGESVFEFFRAGDREPYRLKSIAVSVPERMFWEVSDALIDKLGTPANDVTEELQNRFGAKFPSRTLFWANTASTAILVQRSGKIDTTVLVYLHTGLAEAAEAQINKAKAKGMRDQL